MNDPHAVLFPISRMNAGKRSILIIEDDAVVAGIYRSKFERAGYTAEVALDGQSGFYRVMELRPHALLLDLMLPKLNGIDILKKVRAQHQFSRMVILVLTNYYLSEVALEASEAGATEIFDKATATPDRLIEAANKALYLPMPGGFGPSKERPVSIPAASAPIATPRAPAPLCPPEPSAPRPAPEPSLLDSVPQTVAALRNDFQRVARETAHRNRLEPLSDLGRKVHSITSRAAIEGFPNIAQFAAALGALIESLSAAPENLNPSTIATVGSSIDFLGELFQKGRAPAVEFTQNARILVVDDEEVPRRNVVRALSTVKLNALATGSPVQALNLLSENPFDLIFLDVEMPTMTGFELCAELRKLPLHGQTPVVFVTALTEFQARVRATLCGGNEFIAKPFLIIELGTKALKHFMRQRLNAMIAKSVSS